MVSSLPRSRRKAPEHIGVAVAFCQRFEYLKTLFLSDTVKHEESEELVEGLAVAADGVKDGVGGADHQNLRMLDQAGAQCVNFALVAQLSEDDIEIFDEQDQPLPACPAEVHERCERVRRLPLAVRLVLRQGIGPVSPSRIPGGAGEVM